LQGDKFRQKAAKGGKFSQCKVTSCGKFVVAFCRFLPRGFKLRFFLPDSVGDGVIKNLRLSSFGKPSEIAFG
jgi:hypothetical protein